MLDKKLLTGPIARSVIMPTIILGLIICSLGAVLISFEAESREKYETEQQIKSMAQVFRKLFHNDLSSDEVMNRINTIQEIPGFTVSQVLFIHDEEVVMSSNPSWMGQKIQGLERNPLVLSTQLQKESVRSDDSHTSYLFPIQTRVEGEVWLGALELEKPHSYLPSLLNYTLALPVLGLCVLAVFLYYRMGKILILPLRRLRSGLPDYEEEELSQTMVERVKGSVDELVKEKQVLERKLKDAQQSLSHLSSVMNEYIWEVDCEGRYTYLSEQFSRLFGYSVRSMIGRPWFELLLEEDREWVKDLFKSLIENPDAFTSLELRVVAKDGELIWQEINGTPKYDEHKKFIGYRGAGQKVTRRKRIEQKLIREQNTLKREKESAERQSQLKSDFLAHVSHEIRTPLNGILGMSNLLLRTDLSEKQENFGRTLMHSAQALLVILNDILDLSKVEAGKLELENIEFSLLELLEEAIDLVAFQVEDKDVRVFLQYGPECPDMIKGDPGRIRQIMMNLLSNAIKFTEKGYVMLKAEFIANSSEISQIRLSVTDTGVGIAQEKIEKIFDRYEQEDSSITRMYGGTGLGLALSKQLIELMHGEIKAESTKGKGTTFWVEFPTELVGERQHFKLQEGKVILLESHQNAATFYQESLRAYGWKVELCSSKKELERCRERLGEEEWNQYTLLISHCEESTDALGVIRDLELSKKPWALICDPQGSIEAEDARDLGCGVVLYRPISPRRMIRSLHELIFHEKRSIQDKRRNLVLSSSHLRLNRQDRFDKCKVLLVDDDRVNQKVALGMLEELGCEVHTASNGKQALQLIEEQSYHLVFMDCQMPKMNGLAATVILREKEKQNEDPALPVIALTAVAMAGDRKRCMEAGMSDYLSKPVQIGEIARVLKRFCSSKKSSEKEPDKAALDLEALQMLQDLFGEKISDLVDDYQRLGVQSVGELHKAWDEQNVAQLEQVAHPFKSSSKQLGAMQLAETLESIESSARDSQINGIDELIQRVSVEFDEAVKALRQETETK